MLDEPVWKLPGQCSDGERLSSLKIEGVARKIDHTRDRVWADASDGIEHFYDLLRRHSTLGYLSPGSSKRRFC